MARQTRQGLDIDNLDLDDFKPRKPSTAKKPTQKAVADVTSFPSREAPDDDQLNIKGSKSVLDRFRALRKSERYKYADLLEFMMDAYDAEKQS
jgi:hypothetical protein